MYQEQVSHERQKAKKYLKTFLRSIFHAQIRPATSLENRHTASSLSSVTKTIFASSSANRITKTKNCDYKIFIFLQALNSNFRLSANRAAVLLFSNSLLKIYLFSLVILYRHYEADTEADKVAPHVTARFVSAFYLHGVLLQWFAN